MGKPERGDRITEKSIEASQLLSSVERGTVRILDAAASMKPLPGGIEVADIANSLTPTIWLKQVSYRYNSLCTWNKPFYSPYLLNLSSYTSFSTN